MLEGVLVGAVEVIVVATDDVNGEQRIDEFEGGWWWYAGKRHKAQGLWN